MNAAVLKRGRRYVVRLDLGCGPDGQRIYKYHSGYLTKKAAQQARTELLGALDRHSYVAPDKTTLAEYLRGQWLPAIQPRVRPGTWIEYQRKVDTHLISALGQVPLQQLTTAILNAHYQQLLAAGIGPAPCSTFTPPSAKDSTTPFAGASGPQPSRVRRPTHTSPRSYRSGPLRSCASSWTASATTGCTPPGGWPPSPACAAVRSSGYAGPTWT
jgi:hypothetical protein